jgi:hypothetical protein
MKTLLTGCLVTLALLGTDARSENEYENAPIHYSDTTPNDAAQRLERLMAAGKVKIDRTDAWSVLAGVMKEFGVLPESQTMVFSKTSKQNDRISPQNTPRHLFRRQCLRGLQRRRIARDLHH